MNHEWIREADNSVRSNAIQGTSFERFEILRVFAQAIYPFHCAIKYFEGDSITQAAIFPITNALLKHYESLKDHPLFTPYPGIIESMIEGINHYITECYDWPLLSLCYLATLEGRAWFISDVVGQEFSGKWQHFKEVILNFTYSVGDDPTFYDEQREQEVDQQAVPQAEQDVLDDFLEQAEQRLLPDQNVEVEEVNDPIIPPAAKVNIFDSALEALISIAQDLKLNTDVIPTQFATWMFDNDLDSFLWMSREVSIADIWSALSGDYRIKEMRRAVSRIITARATEASVEREFSIEKIILGRLRNRMGGKLLKSRSLLMESLK